MSKDGGTENLRKKSVLIRRAEDIRLKSTGHIQEDRALEKKKMKWIVLAVICCIVIIAAIVVRANGKKDAMRAMDTFEPKTATVERRTLVESVSATGKVASVDSKTVTALVTGVEIKSVNVKVGDVVSEGDVLCVLDSSALEQNLADAKASLSSTQGKTQISVSSAQRSLEEAQTSRNIELERADEDVAKAWNDYLEALTDQEEAESEYNEAKNTTIGKNAELERSQKLLEEMQKKMSDATGGDGKSSEYESGFNKTLLSLKEYALANNLTLKSDEIYLTADLSAFSAGSIIEEEAANIDNWEDISVELENYLGTLRGWQSKYREAVSAESAYQSIKAEYEKLQQEVSSWQQKYSAAKQSESANETAYENAVSASKSKLDTYNQKVRSKEDTVRNNESTVNSKNDSLQNSVQDAAVSGLSDKQKVREYEKQIAACTVTAPMSGVVTTVSVEEGNSYSGGTIVVIEDNSSYEVTAQIDEYDIGKIQIGQETVIKTNGTGDNEFHGEVKEIAPRATTAGSGSDVTYKVDISIDTPCDELKMDMTAKLNIVLNSVENVLTVPSDALQEDSDGSYYVEILKSDIVGNASQPEMSASMEGYDGAAEIEEKAENMEQPERTKAAKDGNFESMNALDRAQTQMPQTEKITVKKGLESDYYVEIISDHIEEGMQVVLPASNNQDAQDMMQQMGPMGGF